MGAPLPEIVHCPHCWAQNAAIEEHCQACSKPLAVFIGPRKPIRKVGLGSTMILIAAIAVCLAVMRLSPGLGAFFLLLAVPALVRTILAAAHRTADDRPLSLEQSMGVFLGSMGIMLMVLLASSIAFVVTCIPIGAIGVSADRSGSGVGIAIAIILGTLAAAGAAVFVLRRAWPHKD